MNAKTIGAAAFASGVAAVAAVPGQVSATTTNETAAWSLQSVATDWGVTVPSIFVLILLILSFLGLVTGYARTQVMYYITGGLAIVWLVMLYLGL